MKIAENGKKKARKIYSKENQIYPRIELIKKTFEVSNDPKSQ